MEAKKPAVPKSEFPKWYKGAYWRTLRLLVLARDPICVLCQRNASTSIYGEPVKGVCKQCFGTPSK
jgi:hypothetical protein